MAGGGGEGEINLVPYLDIMINLIMFMLTVTAYIVDIREAPVLVPTLTNDPGQSSAPPEEQKGFLTVAISSRAISILGSNDQIPAAEILKEGKTYPYDKLSSVLRQYKDSPTIKLTEVIQLTADATIPYSDVIAVMDAARSDKSGPLFPGIQLALAAR
jgi:biopolymer transport protein ExbD